MHLKQLLSNCNLSRTICTHFPYTTHLSLTESQMSYTCPEPPQIWDCRPPSSGTEHGGVL